MELKAGGMLLDCSVTVILWWSAHLQANGPQVPGDVDVVWLTVGHVAVVHVDGVGLRQTPQAVANLERACDTDIHTHTHTHTYTHAHDTCTWYTHMKTHTRIHAHKGQGSQGVPSKMWDSLISRIFSSLGVNPMKEYITIYKLFCW